MCCYVLFPAARVSWEKSPWPLCSLIIRIVPNNKKLLPQEFIQHRELQNYHECCNFHLGEWIFCSVFVKTTTKVNLTEVVISLSRACNLILQHHLVPSNSGGSAPD